MEKTMVEQLREIRDKISLETQDMTLEELKAYFNQQKTLHPAAFWQNRQKYFAE